ncbi:radical SAM family heme chaperone HemW [Clostridium swellfunianum]|uniref:radical SAM family heme chaperone HemW n=1 Tax=Clostridium swellfunianum TaxID=1367462 RepID=UPI002030F939|nr:radical SAM family heme chaperone HemW [Clostridium swellfunianum]MCM0648836.1 radical SAM family heme chaperone HemW [Clostridium swellfunianum]
MDKNTALYIHIPFCKRKCAYCDFPSFAGKESLMLDYTKALCEEIDYRVDKKIDTIFIGGGTPTYLSLEALKLLKNSMDKLDKSKDLEFTAEGNPESFSIEKLQLFKEMGVNRLSIGLQASQDTLLKALDRVHNLEQFLKAYNSARELGFKNINVDLMFGLPNQTVEQWKETLEKVADLGVEHISCYSLIIEEGTPFYKMNSKGKLLLPEEESERQMYEYAIEFLKSKGYEQYEISNFAKKGLECRHNMIYWNLEDYYGCGSGASSYLNSIRYRNTDSIEKYIYMMEEKNNACIEEHKNSTEDDMEEFMFMGLRKLKGISEKEFEERFSVPIEYIYNKVINKFTNNKLLIREKGRLYLSKEGIQLSNQVMCEFIL